MTNQRCVSSIVLRLYTLLIPLFLASCTSKYDASEIDDKAIADKSRTSEWLAYGGTHYEQRFSPLNDINLGNVADLKVIWAYQMQPPTIGGAGLVETTPIVVDGTMYITEPPSTVTALDARTGKALWTWSPEMEEETNHIGFPQVNRGVAVFGDAVYVGQ